MHAIKHGPKTNAARTASEKLEGGLALKALNYVPDLTCRPTRVFVRSPKSTVTHVRSR